MFDPPLEIAYQTSVELKREGPVGRLLGWLSRHPLLGGLFCGLAAVAFAAFRATEGVMTEPLAATMISLVVIAAWMVLFFIMRRFFEDQSYFTQPVLRRLQIGLDEAVWLQNGSPRKKISSPRVRLLSTEVPESALKSSIPRKETPWPVWLVIDSPLSSPDEEGKTESELLIFETRDSARKAAGYEKISPELIDAADERLPRAVLTPLLQRLSGGEERRKEN